MAHESVSNAGPFPVALDAELQPGESASYDLRQLPYGPRDEKGWLRKWFGQRNGFDQVMIINSSDMVIDAVLNGGFSITVPPATSTSLDGSSPEGSDGDVSQGYSKVRFVSMEFNTDPIEEGEISAHFKNRVRPEEQQRRTRFSVADLIPGVVTNG